MIKQFIKSILFRYLVCQIASSMFYKFMLHYSIYNILIANIITALTFIVLVRITKINSKNNSKITYEKIQYTN